MGRFYNGDIEGKFWFGIQSSDDISNLVDYEPFQSYVWKFCGCSLDEDEKDKYCKSCFDSKEEHIDSVKEEDDYDDELLWNKEESISYSLDKDTHYQQLVDNMNKIKICIHEDIIHEFEKIEQNDKILNTFSGVFNNMINIINNMEFKDDKYKDNMYTLLARYTLGYQIEYCLRTTDSCNIYCEC
tara:strand:+ start:2148 stop:2702 length:555 start_codon:yes stop_codon:yes gene_type:complete